MADAVEIKVNKGPNVSYAEPIAEQRALAKSGQLEGAIANLLQHEKTARLVRLRRDRAASPACHPTVPSQARPSPPPLGKPPI